MHRMTTQNTTPNTTQGPSTNSNTNTKNTGAITKSARLDPALACRDPHLTSNYDDRDVFDPTVMPVNVNEIGEGEGVDLGDTVELGDDGSRVGSKEPGPGVPSPGGSATARTTVKSKKTTHKTRKNSKGTNASPSK